MSTFIETLASMLNIKGDDAKKFIDQCAMSDLVELSSSVAKHEKQKTIDVYHRVLAKHDHFIGEPVDVNGERAIITKINQPGNTTEVAIDGHRDLVDTKELEAVEESFLMENVFGLTSIPSINRIGVLAGLKPQGSVGAGETNDPDTNDNQNKNIGDTNNNPKPGQQQVVQMNAPKGLPGSTASADANQKQVANGDPDAQGDDQEDGKNVQEDVEFIELDDESDEKDCDPVSICTKALKDIEDNLDDIKLSDVSQIRKSLYDILNHMNENSSFTGRNKKL